MSMETIDRFGSDKNTAIKTVTVPNAQMTTTPVECYAAVPASKKLVIDRVIGTLGREGTITLRSATSQRTLFVIGADGASTGGDFDELGIHGDAGEGIEAVVNHYTAVVAAGGAVSTVVVQAHEIFA